MPLNDGGFLICGNRLTDNFSKYNDVYACRLDSNGQILWEQHYPLDNYQFARDLVEIPDGSFFLSGYSELQVGGVWQALPYVLQIDIWGNMIGEHYLQPAGFSNMNPNFSAIRLTSDGGAIITGESSDPINTRRSFVAKIDSTATIMWDTIFFAASRFIPFALENSESIYLGYIQDSAVFLMTLDDNGQGINHFRMPFAFQKVFNDYVVSPQGYLIGAGKDGVPNQSVTNDFYAARYDSVGEAFVPDYCAWNVPEAAFYAEYDWPLLTLRDSSFSGLRYHDSIYHYQWYSSNGDMGTDDSLTTLFDTTGGQSIDITLIVSNWHGCKDTLSQTIDLQSTILQEKKQAEVSIYPNPAKDQLHIHWPKEQKTQNMQLSIKDMQGRVLIESQLIKRNAVVDIGHLPSGVYVVHIRAEGGPNIYHKLMVE